MKETGDKEDLKRRIESEAMAAGPGSKDTLQCRDCLSQHDDSARLGNAAKCEAYPACRPNSVLLGASVTSMAKSKCSNSVPPVCRGENARRASCFLQTG